MSEKIPVKTTNLSVCLSAYFNWLSQYSHSTCRGVAFALFFLWKYAKRTKSPVKQFANFCLWWKFHMFENVTVWQIGRKWLKNSIITGQHILVSDGLRTADQQPGSLRCIWLHWLQTDTHWAHHHLSVHLLTLQRGTKVHLLRILIISKVVAITFSNLWRTIYLTADGDIWLSFLGTQFVRSQTRLRNGRLTFLFSLRQLILIRLSLLTYHSLKL